MFYLIFIDEEQLIGSDFEVLINCVGVRDAQRHPITPDSPPGYPLIGVQIEKCSSIPIGTNDKCKYYTNLLNVSYQESHRLQCETIKQAECPKWHSLKSPRVTASRFGEICHKMENSRAKPQLLADKILQPKPPTSFAERMMKWGRDNEDVAVQVYSGLDAYKNVQVFECGLFISPEDSYLGASPDRVVYDPLATYPWGLLEVKCPHSVRKKTPLQAAKEAKTFMCREENGLLYLNETHQYYYQVQGQLGIAGAKWCDFVVYTMQGISIQRINYDAGFWKSKAQLLSKFYYSYFLPKYINLHETV